MTVRSGWLLDHDDHGGGQSRTDTRMVPVGTWTPTGELTTRGGVIPGGDPFSLTRVADMQFAIGPGRAIVQGRAGQGAYPVAVTSPEVLSVDDGDRQFPRIDAVVLRVLDSRHDPVRTSRAVVEVVQGTPGDHPMPPEITGTAELLYEVAVPAGASVWSGGIDWPNAITDRRRATAAAGGITPGGWSDSWSGSYPGQYRDSGGGLERWDGSAWTPYPGPEAAVPWTPAALAEGFTNGGNQGPVRYRRVMLAGVPHMQWRGGIGWETAGEPPNDGDVLARALPENFRPQRHTPVSAPAGGVPLKIDFRTSGQVRLIVPSGVTTWAGFGGILYPLDR
ncbi:hypothetical protein RM844_16970 [Streptomyces sp. DSM 44915]|uniref:DUF2510 domain-containing protein n=1 Tax=Streptomyces chisholmiae TaxID=3075540 RepID=A0ABU2JSK7_9ACTN|nr:hypothetical protein [Streptomyces sp. DSM 44915]MDT0267974.1 hypothetical protein [Streptomyces sp. DSM 44915]